MPTVPEKPVTTPIPVLLGSDIPVGLLLDSRVVD